MNNITICNSCGASQILRNGYSGTCEYCNNPVSASIDHIHNNHNTEEQLEKAIKLLLESIEYGTLDKEKFNLSLSKIINVVGRIESKTYLNNFPKLLSSISFQLDVNFFNEVIEIVEKMITHNKADPDKLKVLNKIKDAISEKFKHDFMSNIKKEYEYYTDSRFANLNDPSFQKKKNQVINLYNKKRNELTKHLLILK